MAYGSREGREREAPQSKSSRSRPSPEEGAGPVGTGCRFPERDPGVGLLENAAQRGGRFRLRLNMSVTPIADKYREGRSKSTLKRELKST